MCEHRKKIKLPSLSHKHANYQKYFDYCCSFLTQILYIKVFGRTCVFSVLRIKQKQLSCLSMFGEPMHL